MKIEKINEGSLNQLSERDYNKILNTIDILTSKNKTNRFKDEKFRYNTFNRFLKKFGLTAEVIIKDYQYDANLKDYKINLITNFNKKYAGNITFLKQQGEVKIKLNLFNIFYIDDIDQFMGPSSDDNFESYIESIQEYMLSHQLHEELKSICENILKFKRII
jgi:hypothetical protein